MSFNVRAPKEKDIQIWQASLQKGLLEAVSDGFSRHRFQQCNSNTDLDVNNTRNGTQATSNKVTLRLRLDYNIQIKFEKNDAVRWQLIKTIVE